MDKWVRVAMGVAFGVLLPALQIAHATRPIRVDAGTTNFDFSGESWTSVSTVDFTDPSPQAQGQIPFALNFAGTSQLYDFQMQDDRVAFFPRGNSNFAGLIYPFYSGFTGNLTLTSGDWSVGSVDPQAPYVLSQAFDTIRFTWKGTLSSAPSTQVAFQVVLLNRGAGDFDVEMNYGQFSVSYPSGLQFYATMGTATTLFSGPTDFSFRNGVTAVPEPSAFALFGAGLALVGARRWRRTGRTPAAQA